MDLIYTDKDRVDVGVLNDYTLDLAFGSDENDFELTMDTNEHCCEAGCLVYVEGTEYGGIIDTMQIVTKYEKLSYVGRTWHGILESKIIQPNVGEDYLIVSGEANAVVSALIDRLGLSDLFVVSSDDSGLMVRNYQMNRYIKGYTGIKKMLATVYGKLQFKFQGGQVYLSVVPVVDYTEDEQFDKDQVELEIKKQYHPVNHLICLGKGELSERNIIHLYADKEGRISESQSMFGLDEVTEVYDYSNVESEDELRQSGVEKLKEYNSSGNTKLDLSSESAVYDIGDIVGSKETITGAYVKDTITKKIVTIKHDEINIQYKVGE